MGDSLIKIGLTGLRAHQTALSTTGNNVTNANTPGYSRQRVTFETNPTLPSAGGYQGTGVNISNIERLNSQFINNQLRMDASAFNEYKSLLGYLSQVDGLLADSSTGMAPAMNNFFKALHTAADDPSSIPARSLLISEAEGLVNRFKSLHSQLTQIGTSVNQEMSVLVPQINTLSQNIAELNVAIVAAGGGTPGQQPNDLLDKRDEMVRQLSELVSVSVVDAGDGTVNLFVGKGQPLVMRDRANTLEVSPSTSDRNHLEIALRQNGQTSLVTSEISGGKLGGVLLFRDSVLQESINSLGRIALTIVDTVNAQHELGIDLEGQLGGEFFADINSDVAQRSRVTPNRNNPASSTASFGVEIIDTGALTTDEYELRFTGAGSFEVVTSGGVVKARGSVPSPLETEDVLVSFDGISINFKSGTFQPGDRYSITPTRYGARDVGLSISRPEDVALGFPVRAEANSANTGTAVISQGEMLAVRDVALQPFSANGQVSLPLTVKFITDTIYEVLDQAGQPLNPPLANQLYTPGVTNQLFSADPGATMVRAQGAEVGRVVLNADNGYDAFTLSLATEGVAAPQYIAVAADSSAKQIAEQLNKLSGVKANAYSEVSLSNFTDGDGDGELRLEINSISLTLTAPNGLNAGALAQQINNNSSLQSQGFYAIVEGGTLRIANSRGEDIEISVAGGALDSVDVGSPRLNPAPAPVVVGGGNSATVGGFLDVTLADGMTLTSTDGANSVFGATPAAEPAFLGFQFSMSGTPREGDQFRISFNAAGVSDNRNALALAGLEAAATMGSGKLSFNGAYSQIVQTVGTQTNHTRINVETSQALLRQSESRWQSLSGVNLDEEAGKLIQFQAAYNASAKVMGVARELFDTLIATFR